MTNPILATLRQVPLDLAAVNARWALIGGFAVSTYAAPRFTRDLDVCVLVDGDAEAEALISTLLRRGYQILSIVEQDRLGRLATARLVAPGAGSVLVDLLFASSGIEHEIVQSAQLQEVVPGLRLPVAAAGHLVTLKLLAREASRPQDAADLASLRDILTDQDKELARTAAHLITNRGYDRDRPLTKLVEDYLA